MLRLADAIGELPVKPDDAPLVEAVVALVQQLTDKLKAFLARPDSEMRANEGKMLKDLLRVSEGMKLDFSDFADMLRSKVAALVPLPDDDAGKIYCLCAKPYDPAVDVEMIECDACNDWFHYKCVNITAQQAANIAATGQQWYCPNCAPPAAPMPPPVLPYAFPPGMNGFPMWSAPAAPMFIAPAAPRSQNKPAAKPVLTTVAPRPEILKVHGPLTELMALYFYFCKHPSVSDASSVVNGGEKASDAVTHSAANESPHGAFGVEWPDVDGKVPSGEGAVES